VTALASRRRQATRRAGAAVGVAIAVVIGLSVWGAVTLASSTIGREVDERPVALRLPFTATGLLGLVDDDGRLASAVVIVLDPSGVGGSLVSIAPEADVASGRAESSVTLAEGVATGGESMFALDAESLAGIGFDAVLLADEDRLAELLSPVGPVETASGSLTSAGVAGALATPVDGTDPGAHLVADSDLWSAIADAVGDGVPALADAVTVGALEPDSAPVGMGQLTRRLFAGPVAHRMLPIRSMPSSIGGDPVMGHDWSEMLVVMAQIAPTRVAAPLAASTVRVVSPGGVDMAIEAVDRLGLAGLNVVSVDASAAALPPVTRILVADAGAVTDAADFSAVFGTVETAVADPRIDGVDVIVELGETFLDDLDRPIAQDLVGSLFAPGS
jgi:hypothetical protein